MTEFGFTWKDLIMRWGIERFDLIKQIRISDGELKPYDFYENRVIDPTTEYGYRVFRELLHQTFKKRPDLIESIFQQKIPDYILHEKNQPEYHSPKLKRHKNWQLIEQVLQANKCVVGDFTMPTDEIEAETLILNAEGWLFKTDDVLAFEKKHLPFQSSKYIPNSLQDPAGKVDQPSNEIPPDDFLKKLVLHPENDNEIIFQVGQKKHPFYLNQLGEKQREVLKEILDNPKNIFSLGPSLAKKEYYRRVQLIRELSKNIVDFLNKEFDVSIPRNHFLFILCPKEGTGKYGPIFQIAGSTDREKEIAKLREKKKSELFAELKKAIKNPSRYDADNLKFIVTVLKEKGMKDEKLRKFIKSVMPDDQMIKADFDELPQADFDERSQYEPSK